MSLTARSRRPPLPATALTAIATVALAACQSASGTESTDTDAGGLHVVASFYPLEWLSQQVAGDLATVSSLTPPGVEPHDHELTPRDVAAITEADLVVHLPTLQPSVDDAVAQQAADRSFDASGPADLDLSWSPDHDHHHDEEEGDHDEGAADDGTTDPHFWHDPLRMAAVGDALAESLARVDEDGAESYRANATGLREQLEALDAEFRAGLATCASRDILTSHSAFGYLADAFDLHQVGISGLAPDGEPAPSALTAASEFMRTHGVDTVYVETLVSPAVAETVARETGAQTLSLDPIEGLTEESAGEDYLALMRANLASLRAGQQCS